MKSDLIPLAEEKSNQSPSQPLPLLSLLLLRLLLKLPLQPLLLPLKPQLKKSGLVLNKSELVLNKLELDNITQTPNHLIKADSNSEPHKSMNGSSTPSSLLPEKRSKHDPKISV